MGKYVGKTSNVKKAYIKLKEGYKIDILADK
jgi:ribosomal protein L23